jgi:hypothetical protein
LKGLEMEDVGIFMAFWSILRPFGIFCGYLEYFVLVQYIFHCFGLFYQENLATLNCTESFSLKPVRKLGGKFKTFCKK